jgi:hypothetical protein
MRKGVVFDVILRCLWQFGCSEHLIHVNRVFHKSGNNLPILNEKLISRVPAFMLVIADVDAVRTWRKMVIREFLILYKER